MHASRRISRGLIPLAAAVALFLGSSAGAPAAWAHVHASSDNAVRGAPALVTFQVPNESNSGSPTTVLTVAVPNAASVSTEYLPGWAATLDRDAAAGIVRSVTWTAAPNAGIGTDQFGLFRMSVQLPDADTVSFPVTQTYADGTVVKWDQPPLPGGGEPERPAPMLTLAAGPAAPHQHNPPTGHTAAPTTSTSPDNTARLLGGAALVVAAAGVFLMLIRQRA